MLLYNKVVGELFRQICQLLSANLLRHKLNVWAEKHTMHTNKSEDIGLMDELYWHISQLLGSFLENWFSLLTFSISQTSACFVCFT